MTIAILLEYREIFLIFCETWRLVQKPGDSRETVVRLLVYNVALWYSIYVIKCSMRSPGNIVLLWKLLSSK